MQIKKSLFAFLLIQIVHPQKLFSLEDRLDPFLVAAKSHGGGTTMPRYGASTVFSAVTSPIWIPLYIATLPINLVFSSYDIYQVNWLDNLIAYTTEGLRVKLARMEDLVVSIANKTPPKLEKLKFEKPGNPLNDFEIKNPHFDLKTANELCEAFYLELFGKEELTKNINWTPPANAEEGFSAAGILKDVYTNQIFWCDNFQAEKNLNLSSTKKSLSDPESKIFKELLFFNKMGLPTVLLWVFLMGNIALTILDARVGSYIPQKTTGKIEERDRDILLTMLYFITKFFDHYNFKSTISKLPTIIESLKALTAHEDLTQTNKDKVKNAIDCCNVCYDFGIKVLAKLEYNIPRAFTTVIVRDQAGIIESDVSYWAWHTQFHNGPLRAIVTIAQAVYASAYAMFPWTAPSSPPSWFTLYEQDGENQIRMRIDKVQETVRVINTLEKEGVTGINKNQLMITTGV